MAYEFDDGVTAACNGNKRTNDQQDGGIGDRAGHGPLARYDRSNVCGVCAQSRNMSIVENTVTDTVEMANKRRTLEVVAHYRTDFDLRPAISYVRKWVAVEDGADWLWPSEIYSGGRVYCFNKNMKTTWVDYRFSTCWTKTTTAPATFGTDDQAAVVPHSSQSADPFVLCLKTGLRSVLSLLEKCASFKTGGLFGA